MPIQWNPINRDASPTAAASLLAKAMPDAINLGQGRETEEPEGDVGAILRGSFRPDSGYNTSVGGPMGARERAAYWLERFIGVQADAETTLLLNQHGRAVLDMTHQLAIRPHQGRGHSPLALTPSPRWPHIDGLLDDHGLVARDYDMMGGDVVASYEEVVAQTDPKLVAMEYFNFPFNPTGRHISNEENHRIMEIRETMTLQTGVSTLRVDDMPYFAACAQNPSGHSGPDLDTGYDGILRPDQKTKWVLIASFSKALAQSKTGLTIVAVHPELKGWLKQRFTRTIGMNYPEQFMQSAGLVLSPLFDKAVLEHFHGLREKYVANRESLVDLFGDAVVAGGPMMTSLLKLSPDLFGRVMTRPDGEELHIADVNDVIEYLANMQGVIVVNNGGNLAQGTGLLRVAQAQKPERFEEGIHGIHAGLDEIRNGALNFDAGR